MMEKKRLSLAVLKRIYAIRSPTIELRLIKYKSSSIHLTSGVEVQPLFVTKGVILITMK